MTDLWRDMDFALPAGHPSTFEAECKQLRVKLQEAESAVNWADITKNRAVDEAKQLRAENERLRMALTAIAKSASVQVDRPKKMLPAWRTIAVERIDIARAALKGTKT